MSGQQYPPRTNYPSQPYNPNQPQYANYNGPSSSTPHPHSPPHHSYYPQSNHPPPPPPIRQQTGGHHPPALVPGGYHPASPTTWYPPVPPPPPNHYVNNRPRATSNAAYPNTTPPSGYKHPGPPPPLPPKVVLEAAAAALGKSYPHSTPSPANHSSPGSGYGVASTSSATSVSGSPPGAYDPLRTPWTPENAPHYARMEDARRELEAKDAIRRAADDERRKEDAARLAELERLRLENQIRREEEDKRQRELEQLRKDAEVKLAAERRFLELEREKIAEERRLLEQEREKQAREEQERLFAEHERMAALRAEEEERLLEELRKQEREAAQRRAAEQAKRDAEFAELRAREERLAQEREANEREQEALARRMQEEEERAQQREKEQRERERLERERRDEEMARQLMAQDDREDEVARELAIQAQIKVVLEQVQKERMKEAMARGYNPPPQADQSHTADAAPPPVTNVRLSQPPAPATPQPMPPVGPSGPHHQHTNSAGQLPGYDEVSGITPAAAPPRRSVDRPPSFDGYGPPGSGPSGYQRPAALPRPGDKVVFPPGAAPPAHPPPHQPPQATHGLGPRTTSVGGGLNQMGPRPPHSPGRVAIPLPPPGAAHPHPHMHNNSLPMNHHPGMGHPPAGHPNAHPHAHPTALQPGNRPRPEPELPSRNEKQGAGKLRRPQSASAAVVQGGRKSFGADVRGLENQPPPPPLPGAGGHTPPMGTRPLTNSQPSGAPPHVVGGGGGPGAGAQGGPVRAQPGPVQGPSGAGPSGGSFGSSASGASGSGAVAGPSSSGMGSQETVLTGEIMRGVSIGFDPPVISYAMPPAVFPDAIILPAPPHAPFHIQAPNWRHLLRLLSYLSHVRLEPSPQAMAREKTTPNLVAVLQFLRIGNDAPWRTILYLSIESPLPPNTQDAWRYTSGDTTTLPYNFIPPANFPFGNSPQSQVYTVVVPSQPLPILPVPLTNVALYLHAALDASRKQGSEGTSLRRLVTILAAAYPDPSEGGQVAAQVTQEQQRKGGVGGLFQRAFGGRSKSAKAVVTSTNEETYDRVTPFRMDDYH